MKNITVTKTEILIAWLIIALSAAGLFAADTASGPKPAVSEAVNAALDENGDAAFAEDLRGAQELLKGLSRERHMPPAQSREYMAREVERARKFFAFANKDLFPHTRSMMRKMQDPDGMIAAGLEMIEKNPSSWQGYDFLATGNFRKMKIDEAMAGFEKAVQAAPDMQKDWYRYMLATCHRMKENPEKAFETYERIIAANENWIAVKNSYLGASTMLLSRNMAKAAEYFDKGMTLCTPEERAGLLKAGVCDRFSGSPKLPATCSKGNAL